jgi:hypothetical protein
LQEDLNGLRQISPPLGFVKNDDLPMQWGLPPVLLSDTSDGNFLFLLNRFRRSTAHPVQSTEASLALADSAAGSSKEILLQKPLVSYWFLLSGSLKYIAYSQHNEPKLIGTTAQYQPFTLNLLVQSLQTGEVKTIWSKEHAENREPPYLSLAGWIRP